MTFGRHTKIQKVLNPESSNLFSNNDMEFIWKFIHFVKSSPLCRMNRRMQVGNMLCEEEDKGLFIEDKSNYCDKDRFLYVVTVQKEEVNFWS